MLFTKQEVIELPEKVDFYDRKIIIDENNLPS
jgi:hypothetical protein